ncbi:MAG TPA: hypothetical protein VNW92_30420 [Polyangiaceae bacterium]|nr:hypothetical protein [Polyangiaceae bacterium]
MTSAAATLPEAPETRAEPSRTASAVEFLAVGGAGVLLFPVLWLLRRAVGLDSAELAVGFLMFHGAHLINDPHFSVTYLLFYKNAKQRAFGAIYAPAQRARYVVAGFFVPCALALWLTLALASSSARSLGALIQLMFLLVGWHYVKQGFGVLTVLSARRGVRYSALERRVILAHCFAGWAYAWSSPATPAVEAEEKGVIYLAVAHPALVERVTYVAFVLSALLLCAVLYRKWRREGRLPPLAPLTGLLVSIWLWSVYSSADPLMLYVIPALHSLQYLYFVWLLTKNQAQAAVRPPFFGPPASHRLLFLAASALALGWLLFHGSPAVLDGARLSAHRHAREPLGALGPTPYFAAFFAFVNIHHYFMDNVIWRRENPETRHLQD